MINKDSLPKDIRKVIDLVDLKDYAASCKAVEGTFTSLKKEEEFCDFTTKDGIRFRLHRDFDDSLARVDFDIRQDDIEELDEDDIEQLTKEYFEDWQKITEQFITVFGKPNYSNGFGNKGYPEETEAQWVSLWNLGNERLTLEVHDGHDIIPQYMNAVYSA